MTPSRIQKAVIYCRASGSEAQQRADNLLLQETSCRAHATRQGYDVVNTFNDAGSVNDAERPGLSSFLAYLAMHPDEGHTVIVDGVSRLARNVSSCADLRTAIHNQGGKLEIPAVHAGMAR